MKIVGKFVLIQIIIQGLQFGHLRFEALDFFDISVDKKNGLIILELKGIQLIGQLLALMLLG